MSRLHRRPIYSLVLFCAVSAGVSLGESKKTVNTAADLPRFSYALTQPASSLLATPSPDGRMHLIDPKTTITLLKQQQSK